jgi:hypothetical protein
VAVVDKLVEVEASMSAEAGMGCNRQNDGDDRLKLTPFLPKIKRA